MRFAMLGLVAAGCAAQARSDAAAGAPPAAVEVVHGKLAAAPLWVAGTVTSADHAIISTRTAATVERVLVREGSRVQGGALLIRLADRDVRAQLAAARTALEAAQSNEQRVRGLVASGHAPAAQLDPLVAQRAQAEGQVRSLQAALAYSEMRAPFAGVVLSKLVSPGDLVAPGQPMLELAGAALEIVATLSEQEARDTRPGMDLPFAASGVEGMARVAALSPGADPVSHRGILRAAVVSSSGGLRPGDFARLQLSSSGGEERIWIPRSAVVHRGDLAGVFVAAGGRAELRWLAMGDERGDPVAVRAGLSPSDAVVKAPGALRDGDAVEPRNAR
ncbi:MAG TPA: efflux RND transporter periplasmic adaptor subunit [Myxococcales bacterium]|nr:efflux RND transporter periplasmic adaptor subunit [Myxococcales bacterium]